MSWLRGASSGGSFTTFLRGIRAPPIHSILVIVLTAMTCLLLLGGLDICELGASRGCPAVQGGAELFVGLCAIKNNVIAGAVASTGEPAFAVDRRGEIVAWNPAAEKCFGFGAQEAVGQHCWKLLAGQDVFENRYCCEGCPIRGAAFSHEPIRDNQLRLKTAGRRRQKFDVCMLLVPDGNGSELLVHLCRPASEAAENLRGAGLDRPGRIDSNRRRLTDREIEVLALLSRGLETGEVASQLCISETTVRNHVQHILGKLRVHGRVAAIARGRQLGLI